MSAADPLPVVLDQAGPAPGITTSSPVTSDNKKLRLSCDNCHAAKVKCTKERPLCSRCANSGASCIYSKSRRAGKPKGCGKKATPFSKITNTPPEFSSRPESPQSTDARMSLDFDDATWSVDFAPSRRGSTLDQTFTTIQAMVEATGTLDPTLTQTFSHTTAMDTDDFGTTAYSANLFAASTDYKLSPEWLSGVDPAAHVAYTTELAASGATVVMYPEFPSDASTLNDDCSVSGLTAATTAATSTANCNCMGSLQDILSMLNATMPSFDKFLAINKSAVQRMAHSLSCHCLPDISSVMLLSVIITRIVESYKKIRNGEQCQGTEEVGVTLGMMKMDSEDEYQIKMVLIRSELRKIKGLVMRFRDRFENYLQGPDRQLYEANMAFLEHGLDDTIKGL
jgi:hypothetical protein